MTDSERGYILEQIDVCLDKMMRSHVFGVKYDPRGALISLKAAINAMQAQAVIPEAHDDDGEAWEFEVDARLDRLEQRLVWLETVSNFGTSLKGKGGADRGIFGG